MGSEAIILTVSNLRDVLEMNESIADGGIPFCHELVLRYWVTLQVKYQPETKSGSNEE
jgi:hypothetical protein